MRGITRLPHSAVKLSSRTVCLRPFHHRTAIIAPVFLSKSAGTKDAEPDLYETMAKVLELKKMTETVKSNSLEPKRFTGDIGERVGFICQADVQQSGVRWKIEYHQTLFQAVTL